MRLSKLLDVLFRVRSELQKTTFTNGLNLDYISFQSSYAKKKYDGLCERLRSLPKGKY